MTHTHTHTPTHTHTYHCVMDTLVIVTDTHKHIDRVLCTYMTSYLPQAYRLSILIDKRALFINSWLITVAQSARSVPMQPRSNREKERPKYYTLLQLVQGDHPPPS
jgi:hypothetical protein